MNRLKNYGISSDLRYGVNQKLPFIDNMFDVLVSWDVLHYEGQEKNIHLAIKEYMRVLTYGGRLFLSTIAPKSSVLLNSQKLKEKQFLLGRDDDFRKGVTFVCYETEDALKDVLSIYFKEVMVGRSTEMLFAESYDSYVLTGIK